MGSLVQVLHPQGRLLRFHLDRADVYLWPSLVRPSSPFSPLLLLALSDFLSDFCLSYKELDDPAFTLDELAFYNFFWYGSVVALVVYGAWLLVLVVRAFWILRDTPLKSSRVKFFAVMAVFTALATVASLFSTSVSPIHLNGTRSLSHVSRSLTIQLLSSCL